MQGIKNGHPCLLDRGWILSVTIADSNRRSMKSGRW